MLSAGSIMAHKVKLMNMVMEPIAAGLGGKKGRRKRHLPRQENKKVSPEQKDAMLLNQINQAGLKVR